LGLRNRLKFLNDMYDSYAQGLRVKEQLTNDCKISVEENNSKTTKIQQLETEKEQWTAEKKDFGKDKQLWEQQKDQLKKSLEQKNRDFEKANTELLIARERNDLDLIDKYQIMVLNLQKEMSLLQAALNIEQEQSEVEGEKYKDKTFKRKLDKNLGGNLTDNYDDWIFLVDSYQRFNNIKNEQMMGLILPLVRGQALQILERMLLKEGEVNWLDYKQELKETYHTDTKARKLRKEFRELKQGNDFDSFLSKFRT
jgi:hypothetical protein